ncbi:MAG TPA: BCD family MFS transporter [Longimicrobiaceae bacterium]|jgi:BCD family chlorophyll transporter-like MFS transporter
MNGSTLSWPGIARLGLVQAAIGMVVVLMTSTLNRVMTVEVGLAATVPGLLVGLHFAVQALRPRMGHGSDAGGRRTPWIAGGMLLLVLASVGASAATALLATDRVAGLLAAVAAFALIGVGIAASSTPFLALLAERVAPERRSGAAAMTWILMIVGIIATAGVGGALLDPFSYPRLVAVTAGVGAVALLLTAVGLAGAEPARRTAAAPAESPQGSFREAFREVWGEDEARRFAVFIFVSMLAYSAQDLILEPFAGAVFGLTPGESTQVAGMQHGGVLLGMVAGALGARRWGTLSGWAAWGCAASAAAFLVLAATAFAGSADAMRAAVFVLGAANGAFAVGAIGAMMGLMHAGAAGREGLRMGFWGAAQALAYGMGGFAGAAGSDVARWALGSPAAGYAAVFGVEAALFLAAAAMVARGGARVRAADVHWGRDGAAALAAAR